MDQEFAEKILRYLKLLALVVGAISIAGFFGHVHWIFDCASHFRFQYFVVTVLFTLVFLRWRSWSLLGFCVAIATINGALIVPWYMPGPEPSATGLAPNLRIFFANVHRLNKDYPKIEYIIKKEQPDVIVLQEVTQGLLDSLEDMRNHYRYSQMLPREDHFGIAVMSRVPIRDLQVVNIGFAQRPCIVGTIDVDDNKISFISAHPIPPVSDVLFKFRNDELLEIAKLANQFPHPMIIAGDLNTSMWSPYYQQLLVSTGLRDARRGHGVLATWPTHIPIAMIPIDHFLVSPELRVVGMHVGPDMGSDHRPIVMDLHLPDKSMLDAAIEGLSPEAMQGDDPA